MRIAIVNDMSIAVEAIRRVLAPVSAHKLAWVARDGAEAVEHCVQDTPDLILMDLIMPVMDGVEATARIMAQTPCAIVVVTASVNENCRQVFAAMGAGALDAVNTPTLESAEGIAGGDALLAKIETINRLLGPHVGRKDKVVPVMDDARTAAGADQWIVAIGSSAGGPSALAKVLSQLPADFPAAVVIVQHVDSQFAENLANWLALESPLPVRLAREGDRPEPGTVLLAGTGNHLAFISSSRLGYLSAPADSPYRPSIDVCFRSILRFWPGRVVGVVLTGMGTDGAAGLKALREAGHLTIAQDRATCAVYGMPKAAAEMNAAAEILPLDRIGVRLTSIMAEKNVNHHV